jgi:hypothetical protein
MNTVVNVGDPHSFYEPTHTLTSDWGKYGAVDGENIRTKLMPQVKTYLGLTPVLSSATSLKASDVSSYLTNIDNIFKTNSFACIILDVNGEALADISLDNGTTILQKDHVVTYNGNLVDDGTNVTFYVQTWGQNLQRTFTYQQFLDICDGGIIAQ